MVGKLQKEPGQRPDLLRGLTQKTIKSGTDYALFSKGSAKYVRVNQSRHDHLFADSSAVGRDETFRVDKAGDEPQHEYHSFFSASAGLYVEPLYRNPPVLLAEEDSNEWIDTWFEIFDMGDDEVWIWSRLERNWVRVDPTNDYDLRADTDGPINIWYKFELRLV